VPSPSSKVAFAQAPTSTQSVEPIGRLRCAKGLSRQRRFKTWQKNTAFPPRQFPMWFLPPNQSRCCPNQPRRLSRQKAMRAKNQKAKTNLSQLSLLMAMGQKWNLIAGLGLVDSKRGTLAPQARAEAGEKRSQKNLPKANGMAREPIAKP